MVRSYRIFNKGSITPSILEIESELLDHEEKEVKIAEEKIQKAKLSADKLVGDTTKDLTVIEEEERKKLLEEVDAKGEELKRD